MNKKKITLKVINDYKIENKSEEEIKKIVNKKIFKTLKNIENNELYIWKMPRKNDTITVVESTRYFID